ncbi:MAG: NAD(P)-dependent oxidoreductase [Betaproteobacteria bacterium]|nr:NAD(P)-dependent oxidoreductase [Betaproteobacteria bacterium]
MTTLITGAGAIGCRSAKALLERGETVVLLDVAPNADAIRHYVDPDQAEVVKHDICDYDGLVDIIRKHKVKRILHTAAMLTRALRDAPRRGVMVNVAGTTHVLEAARMEKLGRVVLASSGIVGFPTFGSFRGESFPEDFPMMNLSERPNSLYAITKMSGEYLGLFYHQTYQTDVVILRYQAVLAPFAGPSNNVSGLMAESLLRPAMQGRTAVIDNQLIVWGGGEEFVDVRDVVAANLAALEAPTPKTRVYNIGSGKLSTFQDVVDAVRALYPALQVELKVKLTGGMVGFAHERPAASDIRLAESELGFKPRYSLKESIEHFAQGMAPG